MSLKTFINRPLMSIVINVIVVALGIFALLRLPIEKYPDVAPPVVYIWAAYPGASAETVQKSVIAPLEQAINGVDNMTYMKSSASNGSASISIFFKHGTNVDLAAVNVQNRVSQAQAMMPPEVLRMGITVEKQQPGQLRILALESPNGTYDENFLSNYYYNNLRPAIMRIAGVGKVEVWGGQYALRIWLKPDAMARYGIVPSDITTLMEEQNVEASIGNLGENTSNTFQFILRYTGRKHEISEFENLILKSQSSGEVLRLKDVADLEMGQSDYAYVNRINGHSGVMGSISQVSGSNATRINQEIDRVLEDVRKTMPNDIKIVTFDNTNDFLFASMREVILTLVLAVLLVMMVLYVFLQDFKATIIPVLGIIVALIGTFVFLIAAGFSINMLTLFALMLVIGTVVDDSIVVVEAVQARFDAGYINPTKAAVDAMKGLKAALCTTTLIFMVIFLPMSFVDGTMGVFYKQFGLTMAVAVGISLIVAMTLAPALCALILRPRNAGRKSTSSRMAQAYKASFKAIQSRYTKTVMSFIRHKWLTVGLIILAALLSLALMLKVPTGFIPDEDVGALMVDVSTPPGYTMASTEEIVKKISDQIKQLPEVEAVGDVVGMGGSNRGSIQIQLLPWDKRKGAEHSSWSVLEHINDILAKEREAETFAMSPGIIDGYGRGGGFEISLKNNNDEKIEDFYDVSQRFIASLNNSSVVNDAYSGYAINYPQYSVDIDAARCKKFDVSPLSVLNELGAFLGSAYISNFNKYNQVYQVSMQLRANDRDCIDALDRLFVRSSSGEMLPVSQFVILKKEYAPQSLERFNMISSIDITGSVAPGKSSGDAIDAIKKLSLKELPVGYGIEFSGITREESDATSSVVLIFIVCVIFVYLIMVALYESLFIPLAILFSIPFGLAGAFFFAWIFGIENNIYMQVGLIMLIGLMAKTAILITEYATQCRQAGMSLKQSAFFAAKVRLRPILMTSLTMIFGMIPLMFATGAGANGSRTVGTATVGGMLFGTLGMLFIVPTLFVIFQAIQERFKPVNFTPSSDTLILEELKLIEKNTQEKNKKNENQ